MNDQERSIRGFMGDAEFVRKILIVIGLIVLALMLWKLSDVLLLAFGAVLVAIILNASADALVRYLRVPERWSLMIAGLVIFVAFVALGILFGTQVRTQFSNVVERLPFAVDNFAKNLGLGAVSDDISEMMTNAPAGGLAARLAGIGGAILNGLGNFLLVVIAGVYIAADPRLYARGLVKLFPKRHHERVEESLDASGQVLRLWLVSQLIAMACVAVLSTTAYWLIGLPSPIGLGLIAGIMDFIPFLGPILGALPAVLIAFTVSGDAALWTVLAVLAIQQIEGNVIQPLVARSVISIPPAMALFAILVGSILFGTLGLIFGFPLAIVAYVLVKKLYVRETLGEKTEVPGEAESDKPKAAGP
ncbi:AI-2E family transporter [Microvirga arsenatis]|uniref:AI-2E family transporter n=1 Tax=Microvirga arsenatis TaxID=2692265 RepID=A0ABW9Z1B3_9HYPH|nr:AI-2E family transporter [Microvirga arsenatis]NBJ11487.1 AI-2E family transporter [Microvirga arsenatis]NBJ26325.1 AI-2E family transporter [Microvirga arsenatis]